MKHPPFNLKNQYYTYQTLHNQGCLELKAYAIIFVYKGHMQLTKCPDEPYMVLKSNYIELTAGYEYQYSLGEDSLAVLLVSNNNELTDSQSTFSRLQVRSLKNDAYHVSKPWGQEFWLTGKFSKFGIVLKYIEINAGTKTSLQVHLEKFESNFIVKGSAIFRCSHEQYRGKGFDYPISSIIINQPTVIDVSPLTIHQVEALSDIALIEASTKHLDDVIRLIDDAGREDGRIESEHSEVKK